MGDCGFVWGPGRSIARGLPDRPRADRFLTLLYVVKWQFGTFLPNEDKGRWMSGDHMWGLRGDTVSWLEPTPHRAPPDLQPAFRIIQVD